MPPAEVPGRLSAKGDKDEFSVTTKSDCRNSGQPIHWRASCGYVVCSYWFAQRDWKHFCFSTNLPRTMGQIFWACFLVVIAAFYLSFAAYFGASTHAWQTEVIGVAVFLICAVGGLFSRSALAVGYVVHGAWDLSHCLSGSSLAGLSITDIPLGYGIFCSTYDFVVAYYLLISDSAWHASGRFDPYFWRIK
jgi:hypothetical protein